MQCLTNTASRRGHGPGLSGPHHRLIWASYSWTPIHKKPKKNMLKLLNISILSIINNKKTEYLQQI